MRFWFNATDPATGKALEVEPRYEPAQYQTPEQPGCVDECEICRAWNKAGEPVDFSGFEEELVRLGLRIARSYL